MTQLALNGDAHGMETVDHFLCAADVFFKGIGGAVDHQGVIADVDGVADDLIAAAMIPVNGAGQRRLRCVGTHHMDEMVDVRIDEEAAAKGEDDRRLQIFAGLHHTGKHFDIPNAEIRDRIVLLLRLDQHIFCGYKHSFLSVSVIRRG